MTLPTDTAASAAPILALIPGKASPVQGDPAILGLTLGERARLAGKRAGFGQVMVGLPAADAAPNGAMIIAASDVLAEIGWLRAAAAFTGEQWAGSDNVVLIPANQVKTALSALVTISAGAPLASLRELLTRALGPAAALPSGIDPLRVRNTVDRPAAEKRLLRALIKDTDGFMAKHVDRRISLAVSRRLASTPITPNQMTLISVAIGLIGAPFFLSSQPLWQTIGALLFLAHSILDGCDGELARLKFKESRYGGILDFWGDNVVHSAIFACIGIGWSWSSGSGWPLIVGIAAVIGTIGSASIVYWRTMREKSGTGPLYTSVAKEPGKRFSQVLDALSRRDFIYGVVVLALFGLVKYFLALSAIGAPAFFIALIYLAIKERRSR
jgi:1L-myo-inositol 1-phosphate cytidylyltransferase / CDP-L-myo-inositol myo-inositolphosphotransferase